MRQDEENYSLGYLLATLLLGIFAGVILATVSSSNLSDESAFVIERQGEVLCGELYNATYVGYAVIDGAPRIECKYKDNVVDWNGLTISVTGVEKR